MFLGLGRRLMVPGGRRVWCGRMAVLNRSGGVMNRLGVAWSFDGGGLWLRVLMMIWTRVCARTGTELLAVHPHR